MEVECVEPFGYRIQILVIYAVKHIVQRMVWIFMFECSLITNTSFNAGMPELVLWLPLLEEVSGRCVLTTFLNIGRRDNLTAYLSAINP